MHDFAPVDMNGRSLRNVSYIAARRDNQVVLIDGDHQKVVINDFDGKCKGIQGSNLALANLLNASSFFPKCK